MGQTTSDFERIRSVRAVTVVRNFVIMMVGFITAKVKDVFDGLDGRPADGFSLLV